MATSVYTFLDSQKKLRWQEPYVSEATNKKASAESHGIVRGFELAAQAPLSTTQFRLMPDAAKGDGVICLRNPDNRVVTLLQDGPAGITIDLSGVANGAYWICAWTDYSIGATTNARIYILTTAELSNPLYSGKIVVIGWVWKDGVTFIDPDTSPPRLAPASGLVYPSPAIREIARHFESKGRVPWKNALRGGRADDDAIQGVDWNIVYAANVNVPTSGMSIVSADPRRGNYHFQVRLDSVGAATPVLRLYQDNLTPVRDGDYVRFSFWYKVPVAPPGAYQIAFGVSFVDSLGNIIPITMFVSGAAATANYVRVEHLIRIPSAWSAAYLLPELDIQFVDPGPGGPVDFYFDDLCVEVLSSDGPQQEVVPDAVDSKGQILRSTIERMVGAEYSGGPPPTTVALNSWRKYVDLAGALAFIRDAAFGPSVRNPLLKLLGFAGFLAGIAPVARNRYALYKPNTPRAWATLRWDGVNLNVVDGYGFPLGPVIIVVPGHFRLTFDTDENGANWIGNLDYSISLGLMMQSGGGAWPGHMVALEAKGAVPNTFDIIYRVDGGAGIWTLAVPPVIGDEIYVQVFAND